MTSSLITELQAIPGLVVHQANLPADERIGVISLSLGIGSPRIVETILDSHFGIEVRSGLHCATRMAGSVHSNREGRCDSAWDAYNIGSRCGPGRSRKNFGN
ncbi:MAG: aminotransferase class V-fold PLP-dependent enzyme [Planctomycetaceae bacterium]